MRVFNVDGIQASLKWVKKVTSCHFYNCTILGQLLALKLFAEMKGFMISAQDRNLEERLGAEEDIQDPVFAQGSRVKAQTMTAAASANVPEVQEPGSGDDENADGTETRGQMLKRHQRVQNKECATSCDEAGVNSRRFIHAGDASP
jgi:hypothetical protein